jgi:hypothetical protein
MRSAANTLLKVVIPLSTLAACGGEMESKVSLVGPPDPAKTVVSDAAWSEPINVGAPINSSFLEQSPFLTDHRRSLYFSSNRTGSIGLTDLWVSHRACDDCPWETPINLGPAVNTTNGEAGPSLSVDGHLLFFNSTRATGRGMNDIYMSWRPDPNDDQGWEAPILLGTEVSTAAWEHTPFYVQTGADAGTLYFTRGVTNGVANDIWKVEINRSGETLAPATLVSELSDPTTNDAMATFSANGKEVIFASDRPLPHVGFRFWSATRQSAKDGWSEPVLVPMPGAHIHPNLSFDGRTLHFASARTGTLGGLDIWMSTRAQRDP